MRFCACLNRMRDFALPCGKVSRRPIGGNLSKRKRWTRTSSGCLTPDTYPLDPAAAAELQGIYDYLKEHEPHLVRPTVIEIRKSARSLKKFPLRGREGRVQGTRELLHRRLPH